MDFHRLSRRELQALCKKNKIPANMTNVAMADALQALHTVEGLEELVNAAADSDSAQQGSPGRSQTQVLEPRTSRTSVRRKPVKGGTASVQAASRTRPGSTKGASSSKAEGGRLEFLDTPAAWPSRRRVPAAGSQIKNEVVQTAYSTRRSARLLEKMVAELSMTEGGRTQGLKMNDLCEDFEESDHPNQVSDQEEEDLKAEAGSEESLVMKKHGEMQEIDAAIEVNAAGEGVTAAKDEISRSIPGRDDGPLLEDSDESKQKQGLEEGVVVFIEENKIDGDVPDAAMVMENQMNVCTEMMMDVAQENHNTQDPKPHSDGSPSSTLQQLVLNKEDLEEVVTAESEPIGENLPSGISLAEDAQVPVSTLSPEEGLEEVVIAESEPMGENLPSGISVAEDALLPVSTLSPEEGLEEVVTAESDPMGENLPSGISVAEDAQVPVSTLSPEEGLEEVVTVESEPMGENLPSGIPVAEDAQVPVSTLSPEEGLEDVVTAESEPMGENLPSGISVAEDALLPVSTLAPAAPRPHKVMTMGDCDPRPTHLTPRYMSSKTISVLDDHMEHNARTGSKPSKTPSIQRAICLVDDKENIANAGGKSLSKNNPHREADREGGLTKQRNKPNDEVLEDKSLRQLRKLLRRLDISASRKSEDATEEQVRAA